jgi:hypothetical protein
MMLRTCSRTAPAALLVLAAACASAGGTGVAPSNQTTTQVLVSGTAQPTYVSTEAPVGASVTTAFSPDTAMVMLEAAYGQVGIPITVRDPATGRVGNTRFLVRRVLLREPMSRFVSCGQTMTTNHADTDEINMSIVSTVRAAAGGGSSVETLLTATARDRASGNVGDMLPCTTRGTLEARIHRAAFGVG